MARAKVQLTEEFLNLRKEAREHGEYRDCSVKALALAVDLPYAQAREVLAGLGRKPKRGTTSGLTAAAVRALGYKTVRSVYAHDLVEELRVKHNYKVSRLTSRQLGMFPLLDPTKTYLLSMSGHIACYKGGKLHDWTAATSNRIIAIQEVVKA